MGTAYGKTLVLLAPYRHLQPPWLEMCWLPCICKIHYLVPADKSQPTGIRL